MQENPKQTCWSDFWATFYSRRFYAALVQRGRGIGFGFILLAALLAFAGDMASLSRTAPAASALLNHVASQLPEIHFTAGELSMDYPAPYLVTDTKGRALIRFDTNVPDSELARLTQEIASGALAVIVTRHFMLTKPNNEVRVFTFDDMKDHSLHITHDDWQRYNHDLKIAGCFVVALVKLAGSLLGLLLIAFMYVWLTRLAAVFCRVKLDFAAAMRVTAAALVPSILLTTLVTLAAILFTPAGQPLPLLPQHTQFIVWCGFALFGLCSSRVAKSTA